MELTADRLTKQYKNKIAVDRMSFTLANGVTGLLGANGAGKTTLMRLLCGILFPTSGTVTCDGMDVDTEEYRDILGYLPQEFGYYPEFSGRDFLLYMSAVKGLAKSDAKCKTEELIELVGLKEAARKKVRTYSGGMKQRLGIAQALLNDPQVLIMDEPTAGLDPQERIRFRELISQLGRDRIVLLSTHIVSDLEHIADRLMIMKEGRLIWDGKWDAGKEDLEEVLYFRRSAGGGRNHAENTLSMFELKKLFLARVNLIALTGSVVMLVFLAVSSISEDQPAFRESEGKSWMAGQLTDSCSKS